MSDSIPRHVAIIMDGNGRWAQKRGLPRVYGHIRGSAVAREIIRAAAKKGVQVLTLYAFSSENWGRPESEVSILMRLLKKWLQRRLNELMDNQIRFRTIGAVENLPPQVLKTVRETEKASEKNTGMTLVFALSYGSRQEILKAVRKIAIGVQGGHVDIDEITEARLSEGLETSDMGDPDLVIRTSGEQRLSNFMLWQCAYAEMYFAPECWPDFSEKSFQAALDSYSGRQRRFGLTSQQIL